MSMSNIRIHISDACHGSGIEFNYDNEHEHDDGMSFVRAMRSLCGPGWFWQTGSYDGHGYQFFEALAASDDQVLDVALSVAEMLGVCID